MAMEASRMALVPLLLVTALALPLQAWAHPRGKPQPPLDLVLTSTDEGGGRHAVRLEAQPTIEGERLELEVKLPAGLRLVGGDARWAGPVEARALELVVEGPARRLGGISAVATVYRREGRLVQAARLVQPRADGRFPRQPAVPLKGAIESRGKR
jgi:hypothetical protein